MEENIESSYYIQDFILISQGKLDKKYCFNSFVYKNELNRMHCFINNINRNNYCYEIIYLSKIEKYLPNEFNIDYKYKLIEYDNFDSKNRRRFNIINSPIIPKLYNKNTKNNNSLEIIYLINENNIINRYGVFSLNIFDNIYIKQCNIDQKINDILINYYDEISKIKKAIDIRKIHKKYSILLTSNQKKYIEDKTINEIKIYIKFNKITEYEFYKRIFLFFLI